MSIQNSIVILKNNIKDIKRSFNYFKLLFYVFIINYFKRTKIVPQCTLNSFQICRIMKIIDVKIITLFN